MNKVIWCKIAYHWKVICYFKVSVRRLLIYFGLKNFMLQFPSIIIFLTITFLRYWTLNLWGWYNDLMYIFQQNKLLVVVTKLPLCILVLMSFSSPIIGNFAYISNIMNPAYLLYKNMLEKIQNYETFNSLFSPS